jgi:hypothetical protein
MGERPVKRSPIRRKTPLRKVNSKRRAAEWKRCYHSRERVRFVKAMPCMVCSLLHPLFAIGSAGASDNAHTATDGMGRKAHYSTIVPLCREHHRRFDEYETPCDEPRVRAAIIAFAERVEAAWQRVSGGGAE